MEIKVIDEKFSVCKVQDYSAVDLAQPFCFTGSTDEENSLVCATANVPDNTIERSDGWQGFRIQGVLDFSMVGILAKIASLLAKHGISIFAVSTYNTDYIFMKQESFEKALHLLEQSGYEIVK